MFVRRIYGKYMLLKAGHLSKRVEEVKGGKYEPMLIELTNMKQEDVKKLYVEREREPDMAEAGKWMPKDTSKL